MSKNKTTTAKIKSVIYKFFHCSDPKYNVARNIILSIIYFVSGFFICKIPIPSVTPDTEKNLFFLIFDMFTLKQSCPSYTVSISFTLLGFSITIKNFLLTKEVQSFSNVSIKEIIAYNNEKYKVVLLILWPLLVISPIAILFIYEYHNNFQIRDCSLLFLLFMFVFMFFYFFCIGILTCKKTCIVTIKNYILRLLKQYNPAEQNKENSKTRYETKYNVRNLLNKIFTVDRSELLNPPYEEVLKDLFDDLFSQMCDNYSHIKKRKQIKEVDKLELFCFCYDVFYYLSALNINNNVTSEPLKKIIQSNSERFVLEIIKKAEYNIIHTLAEKKEKDKYMQNFILALSGILYGYYSNADFSQIIKITKYMTTDPFTRPVTSTIYAFENAICLIALELVICGFSRSNIDKNSSITYNQLFQTLLNPCSLDSSSFDMVKSTFKDIEYKEICLFLDQPDIESDFIKIHKNLSKNSRNCKSIIFE